MGIKACGNNDQIGTKTCGHLLERSFKPTLLLGGRSGGTQRQIQSETEPTASSLLPTRAGSRRPRILMRRKKADRRIRVKDSLLAVAVMRVPINERALLNLRILLLPLSLPINSS